MTTIACVRKEGCDIEKPKIKYLFSPWEKGDAMILELKDKQL